MPWLFSAVIEPGLSGHSVRAAVDSTETLPPEIVADADARTIEQTVREAADFVVHALDLTGDAIGMAVDAASDKAFESAANVGPNIATGAQNMAQGSFSWGGYFQALGILCLLLAALWFGVWLLRRYGKFNFLPRPGALPKDALVMEAQMPLGPRKGLMVVRFLNRRLLLGVTDHQISLLTEEKAQNERHEKDFQGIMEQASRSGADTGAGGPAS